MDKIKIKSIVKNFIKAIKMRGIRVEVTILYGSYAEGTAGEDSDVDIAVVSPDFGKDKFEEAILLKKISEEVFLGISPEPYSLEEYQRASENDFLYQEIIKKGKIITV
jgi:predicted nucleotidyltransferase